MGNQQGKHETLHKKASIHIKHTEEFWDSEIHVIAEKYNTTSITYKQLAEEYNCSVSTLTVQMRKHGYGPLENKKELRKNAKHEVDVHFFDDINTEEKAYILGLIATDGHVSAEGTIMFSFQNEDSEILSSINKAMKSSHPVNKNEQYSFLNIGCRHLKERLYQMGLNNNKSEWFDFYKVLSHVKGDYVRHFLRGMFDGDGSIQIYNYPYFKKHSYHFGFTGIWDSVKYFHEYFDLETKIVDEGNGIFTCVSSNHKKILDAGHYLYDNATIYFTRKKDTFDQMRLICADEMTS